MLDNKRELRKDKKILLRKNEGQRNKKDEGASSDCLAGLKERI